MPADFGLFFFEGKNLSGVPDGVPHARQGVFDLGGRRLLRVVPDQGLFVRQAHGDLAHAFHAGEGLVNAIDAEGALHPADFQVELFHRLPFGFRHHRIPPDIEYKSRTDIRGQGKTAWAGFGGFHSVEIAGTSPGGSAAMIAGGERERPFRPKLNGVV